MLSHPASHEARNSDSVAGNKGSYKKAAGGAMDSIGSSLSNIAEILGGQLTGDGRVSIGQYKGNWRVSTTGYAGTRGQSITDEVAVPPGCTAHPVDLLGESWERFELVSQRWVRDAALAADHALREVDAAHDPNAIAEAHRRKAIEAHDYLARGGVGGVWPWLSAEAEATGVPIDELARQIAAHDQVAIAREAARRGRKTEIRKNLITERSA